MSLQKLSFYYIFLYEIMTNIWAKNEKIVCCKKNERVTERKKRNKNKNHKLREF